MIEMHPVQTQLVETKAVKKDTAVIMAATGRQPEVFRLPGHSLVTFEFPDDEATRTIIISYASGGLTLPVKRFAACFGLQCRFTRTFCNGGR